MSETIKNAAAEGAQKAAGTVASATPTTTTPEAERKPTGANMGVYTHKFKTSFDYSGTAYEELTFNFERLTGRDMVAIETEMQMNNEYALAPEISRNFQSKMAARAAGIGSDVLDAMPLPDFNKITNAARDFLLNTGY